MLAINSPMIASGSPKTTSATAAPTNIANTSISQLHFLDFKPTACRAKKPAPGRICLRAPYKALKHADLSAWRHWQLNDLLIAKTRSDALSFD
jgi:hypothetical protein